MTITNQLRDTIAEVRAELSDYVDTIRLRAVGGGEGMNNEERAHCKSLKQRLEDLTMLAETPSPQERSSPGAMPLSALPTGEADVKNHVRQWVAQNMSQERGGSYKIPREVFSPSTRAHDATAASQVLSPVEVVGVSAFIRPGGALDFFGIGSIGVSPGIKQLGFMTTSPNAAMAGEDDSLSPLDVVANAYTTVALNPKQCLAPRGATAFAEARWGDTMSAVIMDGLEAVRDQIEYQVIRGDSTVTATDLDGLIAEASIARNGNAGTTDTYATMIAAFVSILDGTYARDFSDLRVLCSPVGYALLTTTRRSGNAADRNVLETLTELGAQFRISAHMPTTREGTTAADGAGNNGRTLVDFMVKRGDRPMAATLVSWDNLRVDQDRVPGRGETAVIYSLIDLHIADSTVGREDFQRIVLDTGSA